MNNKPFPDCAKNCVLVKYFGVSECESFCYEKFILPENIKAKTEEEKNALK